MKTGEGKLAMLGADRKLMEAAVNGDARRVAVLLSKGANPLAANRNGLTALMAGARKGSAECVSVLAPVSDARARDNFGRTALVFAAMGGSPGCLDILIPLSDPEEKFDSPDDLATVGRNGGVERWSAKGMTALHAAALRGDDRCVERLARVSRPDARTSAGMTPLMLAMGRCGRAGLKALTDAGARLEKGERGPGPALFLDRFQPVSRLPLYERDRRKKRDERFFAAMEILGYDGARKSRTAGGRQENLLRAAAGAGKEEKTKALLAAGADARSGGPQGITPLMAAAWKGRTGCLRVLLPASEIDARLADGSTALIMAAQGGSEECVRELLAAGADASISDGRGRTALHWAASGDAPGVLRLLARASNAGVFDEQGRTPLMIAAAAGASLESLEALASMGFLDAKNKNGNGAMHMAAFYGKYDVMEFLANRGIGWSERNADGVSPLLLAAAGGHAFVKEILRFADIEETSKKGFTPLLAAAEAGNAACLKTLAEAGANLEARETKTGATALFMATQRKDEECLRILLEAGADAETRNNEGVTPLMEAALRKWKEGLALLLRAGADPQAVREGKRRTCALMEAVEWSDKECVSLLLEAGASTETRNEESETPLMRAVQVRWKEGVLMLLKAGADAGAVNEEGLTAEALARENGTADIAEELAGLAWAREEAIDLGEIVAGRGGRPRPRLRRF